MEVHLLIVLVFAIAPLSVSRDVVVTTKYGAVKGKRTPWGKSSYLDVFLGIPFATPPVGDLRFRPPQAIQPWEGVREATHFSPACPQVFDSNASFPTNEDCLYLNVYAPKPCSSHSRAMPVMVWIHGGSYRTGSGAYYNGTALAAFTGVVVVTINYRLQALGFLSTLDSASGGNFGLLDQILALNWVKDTIASFHGNPNDVTIFGQSAGSGSVSLLLLSPLAKGLFSKAIMESGVSLSPWAVALPTDLVSPREWALTLAEEVGCSPTTLYLRLPAGVQTSSSNNQAVVDCLRKVPADVLTHAGDHISLRNSSLGIIFHPTVETVYGVVPDAPLKLLRQGAGSDVPSIRGVNKDEYSLVVLKVPLANFTLNDVEIEIVKAVRNVFPNDTRAVVGKIVEQYITSRNISTPEQIRQAEIQILTDFNFVVPTVVELQHVVRSAAGHTSHFLYQFTYRATHTNVPEWAGVPHASELPFVFGQPFIHDKFFNKEFPFPWSAQDANVSLDVIRLWTNMAKFGTPSPGEPVSGVTWPPYCLAKQIYLEISSTPALHARLEEERVQFWMSLINTYGGAWA